MNRTRLSLWYVAGYLFPTGLGLLFAPQLILKLMFSNQQYSDAFPQFTGLLMVTLGIVIVTVIFYGNPVFYRMTLILRSVIWAGVLVIYLQSRDPFFIVVLATVGLGMITTGSLYLADRKRLQRPA